jgi:hypothetical protein
VDSAAFDSLMKNMHYINPADRESRASLASERHEEVTVNTNRAIPFTDHGVESIWGNVSKTDDGDTMVMLNETGGVCTGVLYCHVGGWRTPGHCNASLTTLQLISGPFPTIAIWDIGRSEPRRQWLRNHEQVVIPPQTVYTMYVSPDTKFIITRLPREPIHGRRDWISADGRYKQQLHEQVQPLQAAVSDVH